MPDPDPVTPGSPDPNAPPVTPAAPSPAFSWKAQLPADYQNSPTMKLYQDTKEGLAEAVKTHLSLEKLLGNEKVPIPKGPQDTAARALFNKAMGVPEKPDGYALPDAEVPATMKGLTFDKAKFQEAIHKHHLAPDAARGLWDAYTAMTKQAYADALKGQQDKLTEIVNGLRSEWGDAYQSKVELGQNVINKFSGDKEANDWITATLVNDPRGLKFLAAIGEQFAENKIGGFKSDRFSLTPDEAQGQLDAIRRDMNHPYNNDKLPQAERDRAINYVNSLIAIVSKAKQGQAASV